MNTPSSLYHHAVERLFVGPRESGLRPNPPFSNQYPRGWFAACTAGELYQKGELVRTLLGRELRLTQGLDGHALARTLDGEEVPAEFFNDLFLVWNDGGSASHPPFEVPYLDREGFTPFLFEYFWREAVTNVKEITEDIADLHHFGDGAHHYEDLQVQRFEPNGSVCTLDLVFTRDTSVFGTFNDRLAFEAHFRAIGVGFFIAELSNQKTGLRVQLLICYTPTSSPNRIQLLMGESHERLSDPRRLSPLLGLVPLKWADPLVSKQSMRAIQKDMREHDVPHWESREYLERRHGTADALLNAYRAWVSQFYEKA